MEDSDVTQDTRKLTSLPFEVLSRILINVDDSDITALRLTCKTIFSAMMTRQFWYDRIDRLCKEHLLSPPEEELEEYTITELEKWAVRRIWARCVLPLALQRRSRVLDMSFTSKQLLLIPGGRWLLTFRHDKPVYFIDLDSKNLNQYTLIDPGQVDPRFKKRRHNHKYVWIDHNAPRLSFRLAVSFPDEEDDRSSRFYWVYICQVNLVGHGASATLVAKAIATFQTSKEIRLYDSSVFDGRYFVEVQESQSWGKTGRIGILDYSQTLGCFDYPLIDMHILPIEVAPDSKKLELINGNILVIFYWWWIHFHSLDMESPTPGKLLHTIELSAPLDTFPKFSKTRWTPEASLITFTQREPQESEYQWAPGDEYPTIHGLVIPHDNRIHPWKIDLGEIHRSNADFKLGIFISLVCDFKTEILRQGLEWDITSRTRGRVLSWYMDQTSDQDHRLGLYEFDEDTGRSVHFNDDAMIVFDITRPL